MECRAFTVTSTLTSLGSTAHLVRWRIKKNAQPSCATGLGTMKHESLSSLRTLHSLLPYVWRLECHNLSWTQGKEPSAVAERERCSRAFGPYQPFSVLITTFLVPELRVSAGKPLKSLVYKVFFPRGWGLNDQPLVSLTPSLRAPRP